MPLLQTLAIMFTGKPIPFAKDGGMFAGTGLAQFLSDLKKGARNSADATRAFFAREFVNPLKKNVLSPLDGFLSSPFNDLNEWYDKETTSNFAGLSASLPYLFSNSSPIIVAARDGLLANIGKAINYQSEYKIGPFYLGELTNLAEETDSLARSLRDMEQHSDNLSGLGGSEVRFTFSRIYGNVQIANATVNIASSNVVTPNLSASAYPVVNIGDVIVINTVPRVVLSKRFTATPSGNVSVNIATDNVRVTTASVASLNLANCPLHTANGTLLLSSGNYISVNGEIRQVNTINALGDYLTVYVPFYNSVTAQSLQNETSFNVNTAFATTSTNQNISIRTSFVANSLCLDNVITGRGTSFTSVLQANDRIFFDNNEYTVSAVTDTTIHVGDDWLLDTENFPVFKITSETPYLDLTEDLVDPDGILTAFTLPGQIMGDENILADFMTRVRRANGTYELVSASKPTDATQTLFQKELLRRTRDILNQMKYDLRDDALRSLTESQVVTQVSNSIARLTDVRSRVDNIVQQDIAVFNQVKSLVKGMIRLFSMSCSKKKRKDQGGTATDSDDYLNLILKPNPTRVGCSTDQSDFIDLLDDFDRDYNDPNTSSNNRPVVDTTIPPTNLFDGFGSLTGPFPRQPGAPEGGNVNGGNIDDQDPNVNVPEDPCAKPC